MQLLRLAAALVLLPAAALAQAPDPLSPVMPTGPAAKPLKQPRARRGEEAAAGFKPPAAGKPGAIAKPLPKPSAAELAEQRKLERDLKICIGC